jgi:hypothetical protein
MDKKTERFGIWAKKVGFEVSAPLHHSLLLSRSQSVTLLREKSPHDAFNFKLLVIQFDSPNTMINVG